MKYETFVTLDTGKGREEFESGAVRDVQQGKPRYDLIPPQPLRRLADLYARGAEKYDEHNWAKGMPTSRILASLYRHLQQAVEGDHSEDHWAAVMWGCCAMMYFQDSEWDDLHNWEVPKKDQNDVK